jgi:hypothetical protein
MWFLEDIKEDKKPLPKSRDLCNCGGLWTKLINGVSSTYRLSMWLFSLFVCNRTQGIVLWVLKEQTRALVEEFCGEKFLWSNMLSKLYCYHARGRKTYSCVINPLNSGSFFEFGQNACEQCSIVMVNVCCRRIREVVLWSTNLQEVPSWEGKIETNGWRW